MIKFNGKKSSDFGLRLLNDIDLSTSEDDVELIEVEGRDGDLAISSNRRKGITRVFPFTFKTPEGKKVEEVAQEITDWLKPPHGWYELELAWDNKYIYKALSYEKQDIGRIVARFGRAVVRLRLKPTKYLKTSLTPINLAKGTSFNNTENTDAQPLFKIEGNGDINLMIGSNAWNFKGVDKGIIVDSESQTATSLDGRRPAYDKVYSDTFPYIPEKSNVKIDWVGNVTSVTMTPRLGAKL